MELQKRKKVVVKELNTKNVKALFKNSVVIQILTITGVILLFFTACIQINRFQLKDYYQTGSWVYETPEQETHEMVFSDDTVWIDGETYPYKADMWELQIDKGNYIVSYHVGADRNELRLYSANGENILTYQRMVD